ncbi:hypothetical protein [Lacihabitans soyangensis]|nr:hypothetical protein [Lacihabitans soyangensis]
MKISKFFRRPSGGELLFASRRTVQKKVTKKTFTKISPLEKFDF